MNILIFFHSCDNDNYRKKRVKCLFLYLELNTTLQIGTSTIHSNIIHLHIDTVNFPWE